MDILFFTISLKSGGTERVISNLANFLCAQGHKITILTIFHSKPDYFLDPKINHIALDDKEFKRNRNIFLFIKRFYKLRKYLKETRHDIYISMLKIPNYMILFNKKYLKGPLMTSERNAPKITYKSLTDKWILRTQFQKINGIVYQTKKQKKYLDKYLKVEGKIIMNSITPLFLNLKRPNTLKKQIISVGRLVEQKNFVMLIRAFHRIHNLHPEYTLVIYGDGEMKLSLEKLIKDLNIEDKVFLKGWTKQIHNKLLESSIFALSSNYEGVPNSLIEAMAVGLPVIATDCEAGGPRELITNNFNGILVEVDNDDQMAKKLDLLISDSYLCNKLGHNAKKSIENLMPEKINEAWEDYIIEIIKKNNH